MDYKKIVVPLDGSKLAETVLPHVIKIAHGCSLPTVVLVTVTEPMKVKTPQGERVEQLPSRYQQRPPIFYGAASYGHDTDFGGQAVTMALKDLPVTIGKMAKTGYNYLSEIAQGLKAEHIDVTVAVLIGDVAQEITRFAKNEEADLIVMASRGKTTLRRWDVGNAAEKVFQDTNIPIFLVKPPAGFKETKPVRKGKAI
jgi:nucleotide-binding universal stress UspA family protein